MQQYGVEREFLNIDLTVPRYLMLSLHDLFWRIQAIPRLKHVNELTEEQKKTKLFEKELEIRWQISYIQT